MFFNAVIFDLDNTLYDYSKCHEMALKKVAYEIGYGVDDFKIIYNKVTKMFKTEAGNTASSHNRFIYFKWIKEYLKEDFSVDEINDIYWVEYYRNMVLFEGVLEVLNFLKDKKIKLAILTDFLTEYQYKKLNELGVLKYFDLIVSSEEIGIEKPSLKGFQYILSKLDEPSNKVLMIGDDLYKDIIGSNNVGMHGLLFNHTTSLIMDFNEGIFSSYIDLLKFFKDIDTDLYYLEFFSRFYGERLDLTQAAGGNISVKNNKIMMIKSSGIDLVNVKHNNGYSLINNELLMNDVKMSNYQELKKYNMFNSKRASMETYMHSYLDKYVIHLHPVQVNKILVRKDAKEIINNLFPYATFIDYVTPGEELSKEIYYKLDFRNKDKIIFLANHGLIVSSSGNPTSIQVLIDTIIDKCEEFNKSINTHRYKNVNLITNLANRFMSGRHVSYLVEDKFILDNINNIHLGTTFPDKTIYCGLKVMELELSEDKKHIMSLDHYKLSRYKPSVFLLGGDIYITSHSLQKCRDIESVLKAHLMILENNDNINYLSEKNENQLLLMESEKYRQNVHSTQN